MSISAPAVSPSSLASSFAAPAGGGLQAMGKEDFLKMLVAQLKNQDPMNPLEGTDMAAQLAQFSTVEQLIGMNEKLASQANANAAVVAAIEATSALSLLGKHALVATDQLSLFGPEARTTPTTIMADTPGAGGAAMLTVTDRSGRVVATQEVTLKGGQQTIDLSGSIRGLPAGDYAMTLTLKGDGATAAPTPVATYLELPIDGVQATADGPMLTSGTYRVPLSAMVAVRQSTAAAAAATTSSIDLLAGAPAPAEPSLASALGAAAAAAIKLAF